MGWVENPFPRKYYPPYDWIFLSFFIYRATVQTTYVALQPINPEFLDMFRTFINLSLKATQEWEFWWRRFFISLLIVISRDRWIFFRKKFLIWPILGRVTKLWRALSMCRSCWGTFWAYAKAAASHPRHTKKWLWRILSIRRSSPLKCPKTLLHSDEWSCTYMVMHTYIYML